MDLWHPAGLFLKCQEGMQTNSIKTVQCVLHQCFPNAGPDKKHQCFLEYAGVHVLDILLHSYVYAVIYLF